MDYSVVGNEIYIEANCCYCSWAERTYTHTTHTSREERKHEARVYTTRMYTGLTKRNIIIIVSRTRCCWSRTTEYCGDADRICLLYMWMYYVAANMGDFTCHKKPCMELLLCTLSGLILGSLRLAAAKNFGKYSMCSGCKAYTLCVSICWYVFIFVCRYIFVIVVFFLFESVNNQWIIDG